MNALSLEWRVAPSLHWLEAWATWLTLDETKQGGGTLAGKSVAAYTQSALHFMRSGPELSIEQLLAEPHVHSYFASLEASKVPPKTFNHRLTTVRKLVKWARLNGLISDDPTRRIERAQEIRLPRRARTSDEIAALDSAAVLGSDSWLGERDYIIWMLFKNTTLRIDMIAKLDLDDVLLVDEPELRVVGKGNVHARLPINDELRHALDHWMSIRPRRGSALICERSGERITAGQIRRRLQAIGAAAGIKIRPHDMRHTRIHAIVQTAVNGGMGYEAALSIAQTLAMHRDPRSTLGYLRASREELVAVNNSAGRQ
jgi:site-specific recombinase XerC